MPTLKVMAEELELFQLYETIYHVAAEEIHSDAGILAAYMEETLGGDWNPILPGRLKRGSYYLETACRISVVLWKVVLDELGVEHPNRLQDVEMRLKDLEEE